MGYLYTDYKDEGIQKVSLGSVRFLASQLSELLLVYEKKVYIAPEDVKAKEALIKLKYISQLLNDERFDQLIADPNYVIDFTDNEDYLPDYFPL